MALMQPPACDFGAKAIDFNLLGTDSDMWSLEKARGENGTLIMFICNHCPYVKAIQSLLVRDTTELLSHGINSIAIMPNDIASFPEDSYENMQRIAIDMNYSFPYLLDETQDISKAYGAICTPDFFGYNANLELQYRGRLDETTPSNTNSEAERDMFEAMKQIAKTGIGPNQQFSSMGCSIKWKE